MPDNGCIRIRGCCNVWAGVKFSMQTYCILFCKTFSGQVMIYSTFSQELLAIYLAIKHLWHLLEGRSFMIFTSHKTLTSVMNNNSDKYTSHKVRHLDYISQFTTDLSYVEGKNNSCQYTPVNWTLHPKCWYSEQKSNSARRTGKRSSGASWISSPFQQ